LPVVPAQETAGAEKSLELLEGGKPIRLMNFPSEKFS
jgi:hypothetical protein